MPDQVIGVNGVNGAPGSPGSTSPPGPGGNGGSGAAGQSTGNPMGAGRNLVDAAWCASGGVRGEVAWENVGRRRSSVVRGAAYALAFLVLVAGSQADAAVVSASYSGTITYGYDLTGEFGGVVSDLRGTPFRADFVYDTSLGNYFGDGVTWEARAGGAAATAANPILSATLSLGGVEFDLTGLTQSQVVVYGAGAFSGFPGGYTLHSSFQSLDDGAGFYELTLSGYTVNDAPPALASPFEAEFVPGLAGGLAQVFYVEGDGYSRAAYAELAVHNVSIVPVSASVPEPETWAMLIVGFLAIGIRARRKPAALSGRLGGG